MYHRGVKIWIEVGVYTLDGQKSHINIHNGGLKCEEKMKK